MPTALLSGKTQRNFDIKIRMAEIKWKIYRSVNRDSSHASAQQTFSAAKFSNPRLSVNSFTIR